MFKKFRANLATAFQLLTRLPTSWLAAKPAYPSNNAGGAALWPLVGGILGIMPWATITVSGWMGFSSSLCVIIGLVTMVFLSGGLHEDGLADTMDGFGGGKNKEETLRIMHDSRIGSYGCIALILVFLARYVSLGQLMVNHTLLPALIMAGALSRLSMLWLFYTLPLAQDKGVAYGIGKPHSRALKRGVFFTALMGISVLSFSHFIIASLIGGLFTQYMKNLAVRKVGGISGDILGCACILVETGLLVLFSKIISPSSSLLTTPITPFFWT
ncbi:adenosylcobinamide-GDP ribazoletransferase [Entomobacter blattae]|uniref:Adenosylcobinamide-GDP ribazoletransferase n=1 Tax=Entomobacter blattae TaxID=2762277 RepID=A0A7H1NQ16_9PROT|nr:adenosylcobinamide-GDP ribazoletransferase [Entomobacter blattae]QNT77876.1 Adenosylcobinamide-GDP ribazoletransferase [Entomobacter blattae]